MAIQTIYITSFQILQKSRVHENVSNVRNHGNVVLVNDTRRKHLHSGHIDKSLTQFGKTRYRPLIEVFRSHPQEHIYYVIGSQNFKILIPRYKSDFLNGRIFYSLLVRAHISWTSSRRNSAGVTAKWGRGYPQILLQGKVEF